MAELLFQQDDRTLLTLRIDRAEVCVGSHPTNDVVVPDPAVAEIAAILTDRGANRYRLRNLAGPDLLINGSPTPGEERDLVAGDQLTLGQYTLKFRLRDEDPRRRHFGNTRVLDAPPEAGQTARLRFGDQEFLLTRERPFNAGASDDNDLVLNDPFVSTFHFRIVRKDDRWFLMDLDSTNGTRVNGLRVQEAELPNPATIQVGQRSLGFDVPDPADDNARPDPGHAYGMIGNSRGIRRVFELVDRLAEAKEPVLIFGDSGSGKELVARALHDASSRKRGPFLALNCGALTHTLIESELFGHVKGTFTGATSDKPGAFEAASKGTLFLDEIGELPLDLQPKLLRVLESSTVRRVGGTQEIGVKTRIVAATHRNLEALVDRGEFREDLFHRLFVLTIRVPPLSERPEDVLPLARHFIRSQAPNSVELEPSAERALMSYGWPGNVRELRNVVVRALLMGDGRAIGMEDLHFSKDAFASPKSARRSVRDHDEEERSKILEILEQTRGNRSEAARLLGISKSTFHDRVKRYGIAPRYGHPGG